MSDQRPEVDPELMRILESAARLQELVPDAVLVGGSAAALRAGHRLSFDHDHVVEDLNQRFDAVLEAIEAEPDWVTNRVTAQKIILGSLGDIEVGIRQLIRTTPLETELFRLDSGAEVRVPTRAETLRIKAFLMVTRNQTRDYLDVAALSDRFGVVFAARTLTRIDDFYADHQREGLPVSGQVLRQLGDPRPKDAHTTKQLANYKSLDAKWHVWSVVADTCRAVADHMISVDPEEA